jgi:hypothetical protein
MSGQAAKQITEPVSGAAPEPRCSRSRVALPRNEDAAADGEANQRDDDRPGRTAGGRHLSRRANDGVDTSAVEYEFCGHGSG